MRENLQNVKVQHLPSLSAKDIPVDILRLDLLHPVVSGNKWFKLQYYLQEALMNSKTTLATFGGAFSNHIIATAYSAKQAGLKSIGFIRGDEAAPLSHTLRDAVNFGMQLIFVDRESYRDKELIIQQYNDPGFHWVMEGGYGPAGAKGAAAILKIKDTSHYSHVICAVGTGTMMAGLIRSAQPAQQIIGISALKNNHSLEKEIRHLLTEEQNKKPFTILHDYHFGGYAKHPEALLHFMNETWQAEQLPTDIVYTAKLLFAVKDLVQQNYFPEGAQILVIHSGGLQGNTSLPPDTLPFL